MFATSQPVVVPRTDHDYDGDRKADVAVVTPSTGTWSILESSTGTALTATLGVAGDKPVPGDYDGDGKTDIAVYHPATGEWSVLRSSTGALTVVTLGSTTDLPVPADYDRDGTTDMAVYRPASGEWIMLQSSTHTARTVAWGSSADVPVPGDYDGDAKADLAVYRHATGLWQILQSGTNTTTTAIWGSTGDLPMPGDYDGDGTTDVAVYHRLDGRVVDSAVEHEHHADGHLGQQQRRPDAGRLRRRRHDRSRRVSPEHRPLADSAVGHEHDEGRHLGHGHRHTRALMNDPADESRDRAPKRPLIDLRLSIVGEEGKRRGSRGTDWVRASNGPMTVLKGHRAPRIYGRCGRRAGHCCSSPSVGVSGSADRPRLARRRHVSAHRSVCSSLP